MSPPGGEVGTEQRTLQHAGMSGTYKQKETEGIELDTEQETEET